MVGVGRPVLTEESRRANFTNEGGLGTGRIRYLRNVMTASGCSRSRSGPGAWRQLQRPAGASHRRRRASARWTDHGSGRSDVPAARRPAIADRGGMPPTGPNRPRRRELGLVRCILDSLAAAYGRAVHDAARLSGRSVDVVHLVAGRATRCYASSRRMRVRSRCWPDRSRPRRSATCSSRCWLLAGDLEEAPQRWFDTDYSERQNQGRRSRGVDPERA